MFLYALTIFISAFLLFQVQPIIAKIILPWFGGSAAVWTTCMLFFQTALLGGYFYSHWSTHGLRPRTRSLLHIALLLASLVFLPVVPGDQWKPAPETNPTAGILLLLAVTVGVPYILLSTTGPLIQAWYARASGGASPYRLFSLSNIGSMLALLSYPVLIEPLLPTRFQARIWSVAYAVFVALCATCAWRSRNLPDAAASTESNDSAGGAPSLGQRLLWVGLAACPSTLLLAITTHLTHDVAPIPFLWVLPLTIYLLSFILTFDSSGWYRRAVFLPLFAVSLAALAFALSDYATYSVTIDIILHAIALFVVCMTCHGELASGKPNPRYLTGYYLMVSAGGAIGGLFTGIVAPYLFHNYFELEISMVACALFVLAVNWFRASNVIRIAAIGGTAVLAIVLVRQLIENNSGYLFNGRNFYGAMRVGEYGKAGNPEWSRYMTHGLINHGEQYLEPARRREPTSYFGPGSGIARAVLGKDRGRAQKVGITGLGAGVMLAYSRAGDAYRIYEINPMVIESAKRDFSFIKDSPAKVELILGDARLSLEQEPPQNYDILHMDAFSSDSVPVHLLTREAFQLYLRHLKPDGILVMHISNTYLDMEPVAARAAEALHLSAVIIQDRGNNDLGFYPTTMVLLARDKGILDRAGAGSFAAPRTKPTVPLWTDDYSNLFRILK